MKNSKPASSQSQKRKLTTETQEKGGEKRKSTKKKMESLQASTHKSHSMDSIDSCASGVVSDTCAAPNQRQAQTQQQQTQQENADQSLRINLNSAENLQNIPEDTRQIYISSKLDNIQLSKLNPFAVAKGIDCLCGPVDKVEHMKSGSLLITTNTVQQIKQILQATNFTDKQIPITSVIAWNSQITQGRIYAPEFLDCTLAELLDLLKPNKVIGIRKLYKDPNKQNSPLYVLSFLAKTCPERIRTGYSSYIVDPYYPGPIRCSKCCRWDHTGAFCNSAPVCNRCGKKGHIQANCSSEAETCANCGGQHMATTKTCPSYLAAKEICKVKARLKVSYSEARRLVRGGQVSMEQQVASSRNASSRPQSQDFPSLQVSNNSNRERNQFSPLASMQRVSPTGTADGRLTNDMINREGGSVSQSQATSWITAGQRTASRQAHTAMTESQGYPDKYGYSGINSNSRENFQCSQLELDLPVLTQPSPVNSRGDSVPSQSARPRENLNMQGDNYYSIKELITMLIPIIVKLFLAKGTTEKIECFMEIGSLFQLEGEVNNTLSKIGISSLGSQKA